MGVLGPVHRRPGTPPPPRRKRARRGSAAPGEPGRIRERAAPHTWPRRSHPAVDPRRVNGSGCLAVADERSRETCSGQQAAPGDLHVGRREGDWDDTARMGTRQFGITTEQARSDIAAGLYRDGLLGRAISLGICAARAAMRPDLRGRLSASDRERPLVTGVNGPLMARRTAVRPALMTVPCSSPSLLDSWRPAAETICHLPGGCTTSLRPRPVGEGKRCDDGTGLPMCWSPLANGPDGN